MWLSTLIIQPFDDVCTQSKLNLCKSERLNDLFQFVSLEVQQKTKTLKRNLYLSALIKQLKMPFPA